MAAASASVAADATHEFDIWKCGSCFVLDTSGASIPLKLFARMGKTGTLKSEHELALFAVTKDAFYGHRMFSCASVLRFVNTIASDQPLWVARRLQAEPKRPFARLVGRTRRDTGTH